MKRLKLELELEDGEYQFLKELSKATGKPIDIIILDFIRYYYYRIYQPLLHRLK